jgi:hypothetical protein
MIVTGVSGAMPPRRNAAAISVRCDIEM